MEPLKAFVVLLSVLSVQCDLNLADLFKIIADFCETHEVYNFVVFYNGNSISGADINTFQKFMHKEIIAPTVLVSAKPTRPLNYFLGVTTVSFIFFNQIGDEALDFLDFGLRGIHISRIIMVMEKTPNDRELLELFKWCWKQGIVNVLLFYLDQQRQLQLFSYQPFPIVQLENMTELSVKHFFPDRLRNLHGYRFRSPVRQDAPRVFKYQGNDEFTYFSGMGAEIFFAFINKFNAVFEEVEVPSEDAKYIDMKKMLYMISNKLIDISLHPYGHFNRRKYGASYPYLAADWCFVAPVIGEVPASMYLTLPFDVAVWVTVGAGIICVAVLKHGCSKFCKRQSNFGKILSNCICGVLYIMIPAKNFSCNKHNILFYGQILLLGFVLSNLYSSNLTSFLTTTVYGPQLNTVEEIYKAGLNIMSIEFETSSIIGQENFPNIYQDMFYVVDPDTMANHRNRLNTSYGYPMTTDRWEFLLQQQTFLKKPLFRVTNSCFGTYPLAFPMQFDSPFKDLLSNFIIEVREYGFYNKWGSYIFGEGVEAGIVSYIANEIYDGPIPLTGEHLTILWAIYFCGNALSLLCFVLEVGVYVIRQRRDKIKIYVDEIMNYCP